MITESRIRKAILAKCPTISVYDLDKTVVKVGRRLKQIEQAKFTPNAGSDVLLYRVRGALGVATHWAYVHDTVDGYAYEPIGYYASRDSSLCDIIGRELEEWGSLTHIL